MNDRFIGGLLIAIYPLFILITVLAAGVISAFLFGSKDKFSKRIEHKIRK